jgi:hypothetical protein
MTRRSGGRFFEGVELGKILGRFLVEGTKASFAAETQETVPVKGVHRIVESIPGNKAGFKRIRGNLRLHLGLFLGGFGDESLESGFG